jgi:hypothetical protein
MVCYSLLGAYERARMSEIQDLLADLYADRNRALATGMPGHARRLEQEINDLLDERAELKRSAAMS